MGGLNVDSNPQKPLAATGRRDGMDLITSVGWAAQIATAWSAGIEAIGEDLEGFWNPDEAEGGARILMGPSVRLAPPHRQWQVVVAGGPMLHPRGSARQSDAIRDLPSTPAPRGYAARAMLSWRF